MTCKLLVAVLLLFAVLVLTESRIQLQRGLLENDERLSINRPYSYRRFLNTPRGRAAIINFVNEADEEEEIGNTPFIFDDKETIIDYNDELGSLEEDGEEEEEAEEEDDMEPVAAPAKQKASTMSVQHATKPTKMLVPSDKAGSLLVPDGIIEVEGETIFDEKSGQATLVVPRPALDAIPNGSIVAVLEQPSANDDDEAAEERANRVLVRRQKKGSRLNVRRGGNRRGANRRRGNRRNNRRGQNRRRRPSVHVLNLSNSNRRRGSRRPTNSRRPIVLQG